MLHLRNVPPYETCRFCGAEPRLIEGGGVWTHADDCYAAWMTSGEKRIWLAWQCAGCPDGWDPVTGPPK